MSFVQFWRRSRLTAVLGTGAGAAVVLALLPPAVAYGATLPGTLAVTTPTNGKLAAGTAKQVVVLTVSGTGATALSEANVTGVTLGDDTACANLQTYVVTSPTTISVKTPSDPDAAGPLGPGCAADTAADVVIHFGADEIRKVGGITFVEPPKVEVLANKPVITDNSSALAPAQQINRFVTNGGQTVRIKAASDFAFDPRSASGLAVTMGGKAGTGIKVYDASGVQLAVSATGVVGNSMSFTTATAMSAGDETVTITQDGVSRTFTKAETGIDLAALPIVTSLSVTSGKASAGTTVNITGKNFSTTAADYTGGAFAVTFCGEPATTFAATPVNSAGTQITVITPDVTNQSPGLGLGVYAGPCEVRVGTDPDDLATMSPMVPGSVFTFLRE
jgi:hypothetical protein